MEFKEYYIKLYNEYCKLSCNDICCYNFLNTKDTILGRSGFEITECQPLSCAKVELIIIISHQNRVVLNKLKDKVYLFIREDQVASSEIIECIILAVFERIMQLKGFFSIHASAVELNGQAIVFVGDKESGKTSSAIGLCLEKKAKLIANDHVYLWIKNNMLFCGYGDGKKKIALRSHAIAKMNYNMGVHLFGDDIKKDGVRKKADVSELGIEVIESNVTVEKIICVGLGKADTPIFKCLNETEGNLILYRNIIRVIRGSSLVLFNTNRMFDTFLPDFSCDITMRNLDRLLAFTGNIQLLYDYKGPLEGLISKF